MSGNLNINRAIVRDLINENYGEAYDLMVGELRKIIIEEALIKSLGNQSQAAIMIGMNRQTIKKYLNEGK